MKQRESVLDRKGCVCKGPGVGEPWGIIKIMTGLMLLKSDRSKTRNREGKQKIANLWYVN